MPFKKFEPVSKPNWKASDKLNLQTDFDGLVDRLNEVADNNHLESEEGLQLQAKINDTAKAFSDMKPRIDKMARALESVETHSDARFGLTKLATQKMTPPAAMSAAQFNLTVHGPDELSLAGTLRQAAYGLGVSKSGQKWGRKYGMNDVAREQLADYQAANDYVLLIDSMMCCSKGKTWVESFPTRKERIKSLKVYSEYAELAQPVMQAAQTALDTETAGEGLEWIPTVFSSEMIDLIRAEAVLFSMFRHIPMPSETYKVPVLGADMIAYKSGQALEEGATKFKAKTFQTLNLTLVAQKIAARILASTEMTEDSIIPVAPLMLAQIALAIGRAREDAGFNGDTAVTHQDYDVVDADDRRKLWKGLRRLALDAGVVKDLGGASISFRDLMSIQRQEGKFGRPSQNVFHAGYAGLVELALTRDDNGNNVFLTREKYGDRAVVFEGEVGQVGGSPVLLSDYVREDVDDTGLATLASASAPFGVVHRYNREAFVVGDRREVTIKSSAELYIETDQIVSVGTERLDFKPWYEMPQNKCCGLYTNVRVTG